MDRSLGFGSNTCLLSRFHFAFACIPVLLANPLYKRYALLFSGCFGFCDFWFLFHFALHFFSTFTHVTSSLSVYFSYLVLEVWFPCIQTVSHCSTLSPFLFILRDSLTLFGLLTTLFQDSDFPCLAHHYYWDLSWFLFLLLLRYFSSQSFLFLGFPLGYPMIFRSPIGLSFSYTSFL